MRREKVSSTVALIFAVLVATLTFAVAGHAVQTITTVNEASVAYSLAPGASTGGITPAINVPVFVMASTNGYGLGVSNMTIFKSPGVGELVWNGLESGGGGTTFGASPVPGAHIIYLDDLHQVDLEVKSSTSFFVHNASSYTMKGVVTLIW